MFAQLFVVILSFLHLKNGVFHLNGRHLEILKIRRTRALAHGRIVRSRACAMQKYGITLIRNVCRKQTFTCLPYLIVRMSDE